MSDETQDVAERAISEAAEDKAQERIEEIQEAADARVSAAQEDADKRTILARLEALERTGPARSEDTPDFGQMISEAIKPLAEQVAALQASASTKTEPEPEPEDSDPFASQIDFGAMARATPEIAPRVRHAIFKPFGRRG